MRQERVKGQSRPWHLGNVRTYEIYCSACAIFDLLVARLLLASEADGGIFSAASFPLPLFGHVTGAALFMALVVFLSPKRILGLPHNLTRAARFSLVRYGRPPSRTDKYVA